MRKTDLVEDMIQDLYSDDNLEAFEDYKSPSDMKKTELAPVVEESHDTSVMPSLAQSSKAIT